MDHRATPGPTEGIKQRLRVRLALLNSPTLHVLVLVCVLLGIIDIALAQQSLDE